MAAMAKTACAENEATSTLFIPLLFAQVCDGNLLVRGVPTEMSNILEKRCLQSALFF